MAAPRHMWWTYALVVLALVVMGSGAAQALFLTGDLGHVAEPIACLRDRGVSLDDPSLRPSAAGAWQYALCVGPYDRRQVVAMALGAGSALLAVVLLMVGDGVRMRWRLSAGPGIRVATDAERRATARFEAWCDVWELAGRRRPRLVLAAPGRFGGRAFTTGLPLGRPVVVIPVAYAYLEAAPFDVIVLHELAHVRARDLVWAGSVWWMGWLNVPVLLIAFSPAALHPRSHLALYGTALWTATALSTAVLVLRASLLRRRELAADRYVVDVTGTAEALRAVLARRRGTLPANGTLAARVASVRRHVRRMTASHPTAEVRAAARRGDLDRWEGGFAVSAAASLIAVFLYQAVRTLLNDFARFAWAHPALPSALAFASAAMVWACVVVPAWSRRARVASRDNSVPTWSGAVTGVVLGLVGGYLLQVPGAATLASRTAFRGHLLLASAWLAIAVAGVAVLTVGLAAATATARTVSVRRLPTLTCAVLTAAATLASVLIVTVGVIEGHIRLGSAAEDRRLLSSLGDVHYWVCLPPLLLVACILCARQPAGVRLRAFIPLRPHWPVSVSAAAVGAWGAHHNWNTGTFASSDAREVSYFLLLQGWWICAFAGWAAAFVVLLTTRPAPRAAAGAEAAPWAAVPTALAVGLLTTASAGLGHFLLRVADGNPATLHGCLVFVRIPMWLFVVTAVVTLPWMLVGTRLLRRLSWRAWPVPTAGLKPVSAGAAATGLTLALATGLLSPVTVSPHDRSNSSASLQRLRTPVSRVPVVPRPVAHPKDPHRAADPRRLLDRTSAEAALAGLTDLLPPGSKSDSVGEDGELDITPASCQTLFRDDDAAEKAMPRTVDITHRYSIPVEGTRSAEVSFALTSYRVPPAGFTALRTEAIRCPRVIFLDSNLEKGRRYASLSTRDLRTMPYPALQLMEQDHFRIEGREMKMNVLMIYELVGHNMLSAGIFYVYQDTVSPRIQKHQQTLVTAALHNLIANLRDGAL
ncbi:M48 family metalloprotease [Streptomyces sp. NBC_00433]